MTSFCHGRVLGLHQYLQPKSFRFTAKRKKSLSRRWVGGRREHVIVLIYSDKERHVAFVLIDFDCPYGNRVNKSKYKSATGQPNELTKRVSSAAADHKFHVMNLQKHWPNLFMIFGYILVEPCQTILNERYLYKNPSVTPIGLLPFLNIDWPVLSRATDFKMQVQHMFKDITGTYLKNF